MMEDKSRKTKMALAIGFMLAYCVMSFAMIAVLFIRNTFVELPDWGITMIGTIFGAMSTKIGTVLDYYFGSSSKDEI